MTSSTKHLTWAGAGLLLALIAGSPAIADDVELLLSTPAISEAAKPNVVFVIDSSGSMTEIETSQEPFDPSRDYSDRGDCDSDMYYWTYNSGIPRCGNRYKFKKSEFQCEQGRRQIGEAGSYTDTMAMYRRSRGTWRWQTLGTRDTDNPVECREDSGKHGSNSNPTGAAYARSGSNQNPYTDNPNREIDWGTSPTHRIVTVYDPNFLNWYHNPPGSSMSRTDIVKSVTKNVLGSINDVNVGLMRFNFSQGGPVIFGLKDLDANRSTINSVIDDIPASGWTPLSETLYEAALYYSGLPAVYGDGATDPDALVSTNPRVYDRPADYACSKNFVVLLTDGEPTQDTDAYFRVPTLPNFPSVMGRGSCTGSNVNGACLDDIAEYLSKTDINPVVPGEQSVTTYTIGFTVDLPILKDTAEKSGGEYYLASDVKSLTAALTDIVTNIFDRELSFTAPAIAVNAYNRTQHLNDLYVSVFRAADEVHWPGNIKKYTVADGSILDANGNGAVDPDTGFFADQSRNFWNREIGADGADVLRGGAANLLPLPEFRKLYTNNSSGDLTLPGNSVSVANIGSFTEADFGLVGKPEEPPLDKLIEWMRGKDVKDQDNDPTTGVRKSMGDTLHSQPAAVVYGNAAGTADVVVFNATNDGYLHAINANTGEELWSFVPKELLASMADLYANENVDYKNYGIDGDIVPVVKDADQDGVIEPGEDFVYLVFGMRRGGYNYYMLEVTDRYAPKLRWIRTFPEFGQTWSAPVIAKIPVNSQNATSPDDAVIVIGGGYDTSHDSPAHPSGDDLEGSGIFMLDLETGSSVWRAGRDADADLRVSRMRRSFPSRISVIDLNGDGYADRMYAADVGGQIWRFDIYTGKAPSALVAGGVIAQLGAEGMTEPGAADTRRFYSEPDVAMFNDARQGRRYLAINIGSGYRAHPLDNSAADRFYSIRDPNVFSRLTQQQYNNYPIVKDSDLIDVAGTVGTEIPREGAGWKFTLPPTEKVLSAARTFDNEVYFVSFEPRVSSEDPCRAGLSQNRLYRVSVVNGDPVIGMDESVTPTSEEANAARVTRLEQGGIAPQPVFLFPGASESCTGDECTPQPIACVGVECFDPDFPNFPVRTLWTQDGME